MKCSSCENDRYTKTATSQEPYHYRLCGLPNVRLIGIEVEVCNKCASEAPIIPRIGELHRVISNALLSSPRFLRGEEIRFLRKQVGISAQDFAASTGVQPETLSRYENGKLNPSEPVDKLIRTIVTAILLGGEQARQLILKVGKLRMRASNDSETSFVLEKKRWRTAA